MPKPNQYRPYDDGISEKKRSELRKQAWSGIKMEKPGRWTEKHCPECRTWNKRDDEENWCEHMTEVPEEVRPVTRFPYFNPNAQPGGAWLDSASAEKKCLTLNRKYIRH